MKRVMERLGSRMALLRSSAAQGTASHSNGTTSADGGGGAPPSPPLPLGPMARLQQYAQQQQQQVLQQHPHRMPRRALGDPVSMNRGTLFLGGVALLVGGVALGTQVDRLAKQAHQLHLPNLDLGNVASGDGSGSSSSSSSRNGSSGGAAADPLLPSHRLADYLPSFLWHSHAQARGGSNAAVLNQCGGGGAPLGGCLSPHFISDAAAKAVPAVVNIVVQAGSALTVGSSGSGFIVHADGTILTNAHVVSDAIQLHYFGGSPGNGSGPGAAGNSGVAGICSKVITVTLQDGRIFEGRLVSYDTVSDLAVLKVESDGPLPTAKLGRSTSLRVGEWVVALGSPLHLQNSVTAGIVSCVDRKAVELGLAGARTDHFIQTDAAINKGYSGGPLVNLYGEVIGISAMKAVAADGVSFAIPVDTAVDVMRQLKEHGRVIRPYVGIKMLQLNKHNAAQFRKRDPNFPAVDSGILVPGVHPGSPAEKAGLRAGDCIIGFGDRTHDVTTTALIKALGEHIGKELLLRVARPGGVMEIKVTALEASDPLR